MDVILAIDTTGTDLSVALIKGEESFFVRKQIGKSGHSATLLPVIDELLKAHDTDIKDVNVVCAVVGPGSFTGIRIGVSAMTAIAFANNAKRVAITSFELIAYNREKLVAGVDAGHGNVYIAHCENGKVLSADFVEAKDNVDLSDVVYQSACPIEVALAEVAKKKTADGEFVSVIEPYYMRKSQAEREKDEI